MKKIVAAATFFAVVSWGLPHSAQAYPTDTVSQERTKIRRLRWQQDINEGSYRGRKIPPGAQWSTDRVKLRMLDQGQDFDLTLETPKDPQLQAGLEAIMQKWRFKRYNIALLDITDPSRPRYAAINEQEKQTPGSVAKVLLGAGFLQQLKERFPNDVSKREALMRDVTVKADDWAMPNHHEVPVIIGDVYSGKYRTSIRRVLNGDTFSLWEWMDHALSPSSNASATMLWRETTLMKLLGEAYPPENYDADLWKRWDRTTTTEAAYDVVEKPLRDAGLNVDDFYVRMFFTRNASRYVKAEASRASPFGILRWMIKVEQGKMVDRFSSLELKRMIYLTRRRIRYAHTKALTTVPSTLRPAAFIAA
ncbi:MAG: hypothetical protein R3C68_05785 [Myxococcota bacterium]